MATRISTKDKGTDPTILLNEGLYAQGAGSGGGPGGGSGGGSGGGGSGNNGGGIGGGGGSPGGGKGGGGGKPGEEGVGNNLSFPAVFFDGGAPELRGDPLTFTFTTPTFLTGDEEYVYFAQKEELNEWQAGSVTSAAPITIDHVDIGDMLESAPIKTGTKVRLELTLYQDLANPDDGEPVVPGGQLTGFAMELLGGAKGGGKPDQVGPTEVQGAQLDVDHWSGSPYIGNTGSPPVGTTYQSSFASVFAAESTGGETTDAYMTMSIQRVTGVTEVADLAGLVWNGSEWVDGAGGDEITVNGNLFNTSFGPELNIGGKYIMGASGKPFKFTADGDYLITFALEDGVPVRLDADTEVANFAFDPVLGPQPVEAEGRETWVIEDADGHNGLLVMLIGVPSTVGEGEGELA